jgi:TPP-dependent pyruvate/acetoin dehydrogenase alpha subunit
MLDADMVTRLENEITAEIKAAEEFAEMSPYPADEELYKNVYAS